MRASVLGEMGASAIVAIALALAAAPSGDISSCCIDMEAIRSVFRSHRAEVRACVADGRARQPELEGRVEVQFVIDNGRVTTSYVYDSTLADAEVGHCIAAAVRTWKFARGRCRIEGRYPFTVARA